MDGAYEKTADFATDQLRKALHVTVLVSELGALTKHFRPSSSGKVERVAGSLALASGKALVHPINGENETEVLAKLKRALTAMGACHALMTGLPPSGRSEWSITTSGKEDVPAGKISRSKEYFSAAQGPALFALDFDIKEFPQHIQQRMEADGGLEAVVASACPALGAAAHLIAPSASSFILNTATGYSTGRAGEHWYYVISDGRETVRLAEMIAQRLEAAGWCWGHVTKSGSVTLKTLIDTAATDPARILYEAPPIMEEGLAPAPEKAARMISGRMLHTASLLPLNDAEAVARRVIRAGAEAAVAADAARVRLAWKQEREARLVERGVDPENAARAVSAASGGELMGGFEIQFDDGTSAAVREILLRANEEAFDGKTCADPIEPEYGGGRNIAVLQLGYPPQVYSQAHGGMTYRLVLDPGDFFEDATKLPEQEAIEAATAEMFEALEAQTKAAGRQFLAWREINPATVPRIEFVYGDIYAAGYLTVTYAAPKTGKSLLALAEAVDAATGRGFLTGQPAKPQRVLYFNAEDDQNILDARVLAVLKQFGIPQSEICGRLFAVSGMSEERQLVLIKGEKHEIQEDTFDWLTRFIRRESIALATFDPLQDLSHSPETNEAFRALGGRIRRLAYDTRSSVGMIHHTRKPGTSKQGGEPQVTIDDGRGGSALRGVARFNRLLVPMTEADGAKAGVSDFRRYFRIAEAESNLAPPSSDRNRWFEKVGIPIGNGEAYPSVRPWTWPEASAGVTEDHATRVRTLIAELASAGKPPRAHSNAKDEWAGKIVAEVLGLTLGGPAGKATKSRAGSMLQTWIDAGYLKVEKVRSTSTGKTSPFVFPGPKVPELGGDVFE